MRKVKDMILAERAKGNIVFRSLPETACIAPIAEFVEQPVDGILYDLNCSEAVVMAFIDEPKWVNDFAVALTIRKLVEQRDEARAALALTKE